MCDSTMSVSNLISDTVVGAVLGSTITLVGIWLNNFYQDKSRRVDREHRLKTDVYMAAAEQLTAMKLLIIRIANISPEEMSKVQAQCEAISKLNVVATNETVQAVTELTTALSKELLLLLPQKTPLDNLKVDIEASEDILRGYFQKQTQLLDEMTTKRINGNLDSTVESALQSNIDFYADQINKLITNKDEKYVQLLKLNKELLLSCAKTMGRLTKLEVKAISCIRKELELSFNSTEYQKLLDKTNSEMSVEFEKFLSQIPDGSPK